MCERGMYQRGTYIAICHLCLPRAYGYLAALAVPATTVYVEVPRLNQPLGQSFTRLPYEELQSDQLANSECPKSIDTWVGDVTFTFEG